MSSREWVTSSVTDVQVGDRVRVYASVPDRAREMTVTRIDTPFLGRPEMVLLVESTDEHWACAPVPTTMDVEIYRAAL